MNKRRLLRHSLRMVGLEFFPPLDGDLSKLERVYKIPKLTRQIVDAIHLIAPQYDLSTSEKSRNFCEAESNGSCWSEYRALEPILRAKPMPKKVLELGPGLGRSLVFFSKKLGWQNVEIHTYEGDGQTTQYTLLGPRFEYSFCGSINVLRQILDFNGMGNVKIFNAQTLPMSKLPGPYDLIYSFYSIGFHWSLEYFWDDLMPLMHSSTVAVFTVPPEFKPFAKLEKLRYTVLDSPSVWPKGRVLKLLIIG